MPHSTARPVAPARPRVRAAVLPALGALAALAATGVLAAHPAAAQPGADRAGAAPGDSAAAVRWNVLARRLLDDAARRPGAGAGPPPFVALIGRPIRIMAALGVAQYDAARRAPAGERRLAVAEASAAVLAAMLPDSASQAAVAAALAHERGGVRAAADVRATSGGAADAARFLTWVAADRSDARWTGTVPTGAGMWHGSAGAADPAGAAFAGQRPWVLARGDALRPGPPPAYGSPAFDAALAEVRRVARTRTADQTRIARLWASRTPAAHWNAMAVDALVRARAAEGEAARALALVNVAVQDAQIACWDAKLHYWLLRPTHADSTITLAEGVGLPNFPAYPSGHACASGAAAEALGTLVPGARAALDSQATEAAVSRLYAGVHYRFDNDSGLALGRRVARAVLAADGRGVFGPGPAWRADAAAPAAHAGHADVAPPADAAGGEAAFGPVHFPTRAAPAAQAEFTRGVRLLHSFHYPQARAAFARARALDPGDGMSAAFEALAATAPVWNQQDTARARAALQAFAPTRAARLARARTPRERAWAEAVEALYDERLPGKPARDSAFSRALGALHAADPADPEAAAFYALSLLGLNQGDREPGAYAHAEAVADTVLAAHPRHPGALHYKIHAVDDPANARRGLDAARRYGEVAPAAGHALHMTSHIYIALGMWDDVVRANRMAAATSPGVFGHGTHWLAYGLVQQGRPAEARAWVDSMLAYQRAVAAGAPAARGRADAAGYAVRMAAAHVVDAEAWDVPLAHARPDTADLRGLADQAAADFLVGYPAARRAGRPVDVTPGSRDADRRVADSALARLRGRLAAAGDAAGPAATARGEAAVMADLIAAELVAGAGRPDSAVAVLRAAQARLEALPFAFGPPSTVKIPAERAGELLLLAGRPADALAEFDRAERLAPGRTQAALRRARALAALGRRDEAARGYAALDSVWRAADASFPNRTEARVGGGAFAASLAGAPAAVDTVAYPSGALQLRGVVYRPAAGAAAAAARRPAIVVLHGSGGCWRPTEYELLGRLFAERGYVVFLPCRRGLGLSAGQGEAVMDQLRREGVLARDSAYAARSTELLATTQLADVRAAIAAVRARPDVDPARVAVTGISYGGILTLMAAEADPTLRAAVAFAPAAMNWGWNAPLRARLTEGARRTRVPLLVLQAENDWHVGPTAEVPAAARAGGGDAAGRLYPAVGGNTNDGHGLMVVAPDAWRDDVFAFLTRHLGAAPPARATAARR